MLFEISNPTLENLNVEMFDPGFVENGLPSGANPKCDDGSVYPYCTGDTATFRHMTANAPALATRYTLYPLDNLSNPLGNPPICHVTYPGYFSKAAAQAANDLTWHARSRSGRTSRPTRTAARSTAARTCSRCSRATTSAGRRSRAATCTRSRPAAGARSNQPQDDANVSVSAITKMSLFTNAVGNQPKFYLARIPSYGRSQILTLSFFDIGDVSDINGNIIPGALSVVAVDAVHSKTGGLVGEFSNCTYSHPATRGYISGQVTPWAANPPATEWATNPNSLQSLGGGCTAQVTAPGGRSDWNGKWVTFEVPIPSDYSCNDNDFTKCWLQVKYNYPVGAVLHDATTWTASLSGNPVRLVK